MSRYGNELGVRLRQAIELVNECDALEIRQEMRIAELRRRGLDTKDAEILLIFMRKTTAFAREDLALFLEKYTSFNK